MAKKPSAKQKKVERVMKEYKEGKLHSGSKKGPDVTSRKQAVAIALSEARKAAKKKKPAAKHEKKEKHESKSKHEKRESKAQERREHKKDPKGKKVTVAKGVKVSHGKEEKMREKPGSSNAGEYKNVSPKQFAGKSGGASKYSFPINTLARARNALARAHYAPDPAGIRAAVYKKYPELKARAAKRSKNK